MSEPKGIVDNFECFLIDLDGVIWRGNRVLKEAVESVNKLIKRGKKVVFLSNNATKSRREFEGKLNLAGVMISNENAMVVSSAYATAIFIREELGTGSAYVVGEEGLMEELKLAGIRVVNDRFTWNMPVDYVVVGLDRTFTYEKLACAVNAIYNGAKFIATNEDHVIPTEKGLLPGAGSIVAAISKAASRPPEYVIGKPNKYIFEVALKEAGASNEKTVVIGDRLDTDVLGARNSGLASVLVLTGVTSNLEDVKKSKVKPDYVARKLIDIF